MDLQTDFDVPTNVATCPCCHGALTLEVCEWESDTGAPTEPGCYVDCAKHCDLDYDSGVGVTTRVYAWAATHVVVRETEEAVRKKWAAWEAGTPLPGGMGR